MKKIMTILLLAAMFMLPASFAEVYEGSMYTVELPEGFAAIGQEEMTGYLAAAEADAGAAIAGDAMLAEKENASISIVCVASDTKDTATAVDAIVAEYAEYIDGFETVVPEDVEAGEHTFTMLQFAVDGEVASQYFLLEDGQMYTLTFLGVEDADIKAVLDGFAIEKLPERTLQPTLETPPEETQAAE